MQDQTHNGGVTEAITEDSRQRPSMASHRLFLPHICDIVGGRDQPAPIKPAPGNDRKGNLQYGMRSAQTNRQRNPIETTNINADGKYARE